MHCKILVAEDNLAILRLIEVNLTRAGYDVITAHDGIAALVILDFRLPLMDGRETWETLRRFSGTRTLPVLMLLERQTGRAEENDWAARHPQHCLIKPFNSLELIRAVKRIVEKRSHPSVPGWGDFRIAG